MTETIQQLKEDIAILQEKLQKLEEQDPEMLLLRQGKIDIVDYDGKKYFRIEYTDSFADAYSWYVRKVGEDAIRPVRDVNVYSPLEELYQKEVVKQKDDYPYKKYTPEETEQSLKEAFREAVKQGIVSSVDKPKPMNEVLDRLENKYENDVSENKQKPKTLYDILYRWWMDIFCNPIYRDWDMETSIEDLVDRIEFWNMRIKNDDEVELDEQENDKNFKNSLDLIREWGEKNKPPTLTELLWEWWDCNDIFTSNSDLDADTCIDYLVNIIGKKFIPPSSDRNGYEWEKCLKMMRDKLR
jgi:hypothetical protein